MTSNPRMFLIRALPILVFALISSAASAQSYSGDWPATVSHSHLFNRTYCITLKDGGEATLSPAEGTVFGTFQVINGLIIVTFDQPGGQGLASLIFTARAIDGQIGSGDFEQVEGQELDSGLLVFGDKGGCSP